jgi:hypothetical protein
MRAADRLCGRIGNQLSPKAGAAQPVVTVVRVVSDHGNTECGSDLIDWRYRMSAKES